MFCPQCGHQQLSIKTRFCSRCGLSLSMMTELLTNSDAQLQREKRELTGIGLMIATVLMLLNFFIVLGVVTLPHLSNPVFLALDFLPSYVFGYRWIWVGKPDSRRVFQQVKGA